MSLINQEELKKQLASGEITSLDDITAEFKNILKEVIQTATQEELTSHLGYNKHQESLNSNARNGYNDKTINSKYGQFDVSIPRDRDCKYASHLAISRISIWPAYALTFSHLTHSLSGRFFFLMRT